MGNAILEYTRMEGVVPSGAGADVGRHGGVDFRNARVGTGE